MADVVVCGSGAGGLLAAMVLAGSGHQVTVLERDAAPPPQPDEAWDAWERRGCRQFRLPHALLPAFRHQAELELPAVVKALDEAGALRLNPLGALAPLVDPEGRFEMLTARRPVFEAVVAAVAESTPNITIRRGVALCGLVLGPEAEPGVPHVVGVRTDEGEEIRGDLIVDVMGRCSPLQRWLTEEGWNPGIEEVEDSGFVYYGCHIASDDGTSIYETPQNQYSGSVSVIGLPADHGAAGVGIIASSDDADLRVLRHDDRWRAALAILPGGQPILANRAITPMVTMAGIEDRWRRYVVDGRPVVTGVASVGDAWAATNPTLGRGISLGLLHARRLRDTMADVGIDDPVTLALAFDEVTQAEMTPWYRSTIWHDRNRLADMSAARDGGTRQHDEDWRRFLRLMPTVGLDPAVGMRFLGVAMLEETVTDLLADEEMQKRIDAADVAPPDPGPSRAELLAAIA